MNKNKKKEMLHITVMQQNKPVINARFDGFIYNSNKDCLSIAEKIRDGLEFHMAQGFHSFLKLAVTPHWRSHYMERINPKLSLSIKFYLA